MMWLATFLIKVTATAGPIEECGDCDVLVFSAGPLPNLPKV